MSKNEQGERAVEVGTEVGDTADESVAKSATVADLINKLHNEAYGNAVDAVNKACDCGDLLSEQKASLKHGEWEKWIEDNCHFSIRSARHYIKASVLRKEHGGELPYSSLKGLYGPLPEEGEHVDSCSLWSGRLLKAHR